MISFLTRHQALLDVTSFDPNVTHSACESEISALDKIIRENIWCRGFLEELGFTQNEPTDIYTDSKSAQTLIELFHIGSNCNEAELPARTSSTESCSNQIRSD